MAMLIGGLVQGAGGAAAHRALFLPLDPVYDVACAAGIVLLACVLGRSFFQWVGFSVDSAVDGLLFATALGLGIEATVVLGLGALSLLHPAALAAVGLALVGVAAGSARGLVDDLCGAAGELKRGLGPWELVLLGLVVAFLLLHSVAPPVDQDVLTYHLDVPQEYLRRGKIFWPVDNSHASFVGLPHMLYVPLLAVGAQSAPAVFSAIVALLLAVTMFAFGRRIFDGPTGRLGAVLLWGSPAVLLVAVTARVDVTVTWLLVLAHYAILVAWSRRRIDGWFWMGAVAGGLAVATKFTAVAYMAGLGPLAVWTVVRADSWTRRSMSRLVGFGCLAGLVASPWLVKNTALFGAPFYPYLAEVRLDPWLAEYLGTSTVPPSVDPDVFRIPQNTRDPFSLVALFTAPETMVPEGEGAFYFGNFALLLLPLGVFWSRRKIVALLLPAALYVGIVLYPDGYINLRYLVPGLVTATLVATHVIVRSGEAVFSTVPLRRVGLVLVVAFGLMPAASAAYNHVNALRPHSYVLGQQSEGRYLRDVFPLGRVRSRINRKVPESARIVMLFESRGLRFEPTVLQDNLFRNWPILAAGKPWRDCLAPTDATHVLVNYKYMGVLLRRGMKIGTVRWQAFGRFARECLEREASVAGMVLYRIVREPTTDRTVSDGVIRPGGWGEAVPPPSRWRPPSLRAGEAPRTSRRSAVPPLRSGPRAPASRTGRPPERRARSPRATGSPPTRRRPRRPP